MTTAEAVAARDLLSARAVRRAGRQFLDLARAGELDHFALDMGPMAAAADYVIDTTRGRFPDLDVPFHARWRHFEAGGIDRWPALTEAAGFADPAARARAAFDLAIISVLLDAGAGADWRYVEGATGETYTRSEGLAVASFAMFASGLFSAAPADPMRADARALAILGDDEVARGFQVSIANPVAGLAGRISLLRRLGHEVAARPDTFALADAPRPGGLYDALATEAAGGPLPAPRILEVVLGALGRVWPGRIAVDGIDLGDTWRHPRAGLVPFHKLSQWLAYSLIEPLIDAGIEVTDIDGLTGLAEYRNGGLFIDTGVLVLKDPRDAAREHPVDAPLVVEWRALTVGLLDEIAALVRARLGLDAVAFPLARVLEGGTWAAGRRIAAEKRPGGPPPLAIVSDGTVF